MMIVFHILQVHAVKLPKDHISIPLLHAPLKLVNLDKE